MGRTRFRGPIAEETFSQISSTCLHQESWASMVRPKDLVLSTLLIIWSSVLISISSHWADSLCLDAIIIGSVLATFRLRLLAFSQQLRLSNSGVTASLSSVNILADRVRLASSANIFFTVLRRELARSLVYIKNN